MITFGYTWYYQCSVQQRIKKKDKNKQTGGRGRPDYWVGVAETCNCGFRGRLSYWEFKASLGQLVRPYLEKERKGNRDYNGESPGGLDRQTLAECSFEWM